MWDLHALSTDVSILNGPFGPLQLPGVGKGSHAAGVSILNGPFGPLQQSTPSCQAPSGSSFNPQRAFRPVATIYLRPLQGIKLGFNPQRAFRPVATYVRVYIPKERAVSILNGPFGPLQLILSSAVAPVNPGFNPQRAFRPVATPPKCPPARSPCFNPQRAFRPVATYHSA